jgi:hypothetical protein
MLALILIEMVELGQMMVETEMKMLIVLRL